MITPSIFLAAGCCCIKPSAECLVLPRQKGSANHKIRFARQPAPNRRHLLLQVNEGGQDVEEARPSTPRAELCAGLPEDWQEMSLGALWDHLNRPHRTPQTTIEAVMHSVRERGVPALKEPANIERLLRCDDVASAEINDRIARLIAAGEIAA